MPHPRGSGDDLPARAGAARPVRLIQRGRGRGVGRRGIRPGHFWRSVVNSPEGWFAEWARPATPVVQIVWVPTGAAHNQVSRP